MKIFKALCTLCAASTLFACSSGSDVVVDELSTFPGVEEVNSGGGSQTPSSNELLTFRPADGTPVTFAEMAYFAADILILQNGNPQLDYDPPATAQATYDGLIGINLKQNDETLIGRVSLDADFQNGTVGGNSAGYSVFQETYNIDTDATTFDVIAEMNGSIPLTSGSISTESFGGVFGSIGQTNVETFTADLNGNLTSNDPFYDGMQISASVEGGFGALDSKNIVLGQVEGSYSTNSIPSDRLSGALFGSQRQ